jgi:regulatory protein
MNNSDLLSEAKNAALIYLAKRMLTGKELKDKLKNKGFSGGICDEAVRYFTEIGYINDFDYALRYATDAIKIKHYGTLKIIRDLRQKGIDTDIINNCISSLGDENLQSLRLIAEKKSSMLDLSDPKQKNKLVEYLMRRGYKFDEINTVLRERNDDFFD